MKYKKEGYILDYQRILIEWKRMNNVKEPVFTISRSRLKYINYAEKWMRLHKEGYSCGAISKMYRVSMQSVISVFNEVEYKYSQQKTRSPYHAPAKIWHVHMTQGLTTSQIANMYNVKESILKKYVKRYVNKDKRQSNLFKNLNEKS